MIFNKRIFTSIIISLVISTIFLSFLFVLFYPGMSGVIFNFWGDDHSKEIKIKEWSFIFFYWTIFLIILISFIFIFNIGLEIKKDNLYSRKVLEFNYISICLLLFDIVVLTIGSIILEIQEKGLFFIDYLVIFFDVCLIFLQLFLACIIKNKMKNEDESNDNREIILFKIGIIGFALFIICTIAFFYPRILDYLLTNEYYSQMLKMDNQTLFIIPYIFFSLTSFFILPVLLLFWIIIKNMKNNTLFSKKVLNIINISLLILSIDLLFYIFVHQYFNDKNWVTLSLIYEYFSILFAIIIFILHIIKAIIKREALINSIKK